MATVTIQQQDYGSFDSLDADFQQSIQTAAKQGIVKFTIEGIKDDPNRFIRCLKSNNHVTYYSVRQESVCITDMKIKAVIY